MKAIRALTMNAELVKKVTDAACEAIHAGMSKEEVSAVLTRLAEIIDNSDD